MKTSLFIRFYMPYFLIKFGNAELLLRLFKFLTLNMLVSNLVHAKLDSPSPMMAIIFSKDRLAIRRYEVKENNIFWQIGGICPPC